jgi:hypothetical protein
VAALVMDQSEAPVAALVLVLYGLVVCSFSVDQSEAPVAALVLDQSEAPVAALVLVHYGLVVWCLGVVSSEEGCGSYPAPWLCGGVG